MNPSELGTRNSELGTSETPSRFPSPDGQPCQVTGTQNNVRIVRYLEFEVPSSEFRTPSWKKPFAGLVLLCLALFTHGIQHRSLWASHEARAAQNAQSLLDRGDWLLPRLFDDTAELQKPAGFYWLVAIVGAVRGKVDEVAVRLPAIASGMFVVIAVWWWLCRQGRPVAGFVAGACLASAFHFTGTARIGRIDIPLCAAVTGMLLSMHQPTGKSAFVRALIPGLFGALAIMLKGPIGLVLVLGVRVISQLGARSPQSETQADSSGRRVGLVRRFVGPGFRWPILEPALAILIALPWFLAVHVATDGEFTRVFFWYHHVNRAFGGAEALAAHPWWFYVPRLAADFMPWTPLALIAIWKLPRHDRAARFGLDWLVVMLIILSASRFKRADYLLPAYPGMAIVVGCWAEGFMATKCIAGRRRWGGAFLGLLLLMPVVWFGFDRVVTAREQAAKDPIDFARKIREAAPAPTEVILFRAENHLLAYQLGRPVRTLTGWGDLITHWRSDPSAVVVVREDESATLREHLPFPSEIIADSRAGSPEERHRPMVLIRRTP